MCVNQFATGVTTAFWSSNLRVPQNPPEGLVKHRCKPCPPCPDLSKLPYYFLVFYRVCVFSDFLESAKQMVSKISPAVFLENTSLLCSLYVVFKSSFEVTRSVPKPLVTVEVAFFLFLKKCILACGQPWFCLFFAPTLHSLCLGLCSVCPRVLWDPYLQLRSMNGEMKECV